MGNIKDYEDNYFPDYDHHFDNDHTLDPESFGGTDYPPICSPEDAQLIKELYQTTPELNRNKPYANKEFDEGNGFTTGSSSFYTNEAWIQTYSGVRFNPTKPLPEAILIQDIAHALSHQCRFSGHCKDFYSVAQHSVLVSYICNHEDALWGLLHDATEAYLVDVPAPLKRSGQFDAYIKFETEMSKAIVERFNLNPIEPESVKRADKVLLSTEARDLLVSLRADWIQPVAPLPFKIEAWSPKEAKAAFLNRFFELIGKPHLYSEIKVL